MDELGRRLSSEEFEEWRVMFTVEQLHPANDALRHGQLLAALHNGPLTRKNRKMWSPGEFANFEPWAKPVTPRQRRRAQPTADQLRAQVAAINSRFKH